MASNRRFEPTNFDEILNEDQYLKEDKDKKKEGKSRLGAYTNTGSHSRTIVKKQRNRILIMATSASLLLIFFIAILIISFSINKDEIYAGIYFNEFSLQGMSHKEAVDFIEDKYVKPFKEKKLVISYQEKEIETTLFEVTDTPNSKNIADTAYNIARKGNIFKRLEKIISLKKNPEKLVFNLRLEDDVLSAKIASLVDNTLIEKIDPTYTILPYSVSFTGGRIGQSVDNEKLEYDIYTAIQDLLDNKDDSVIHVKAQTINQYFDPLETEIILNEIEVEAVNAEYSKISKTEITISESSNGRSLDLYDLYDLVRRINNGDNIIYEELPIIEIEANPSKEDLENSLLSFVISSSSSVLSSDNPLEVGRKEEREKNILKALEELNGIVLMPGEIFNFWDDIGLLGLGADYVYAYDDSPGAKEKVVGGGLSQLASNIYIAALLANFEIIEHHNYPYTVNYGPLGFESHVVKGTKNLVFLNSQEFPVRLSMTYERSLLKVEFLGSDTNSNKEYKLYSEPAPISYKTIYQDDPDLEPGQEVLSQAGIIGYKVDIFLKTLVNGHDLFSEKLGTVNYKERDEIILKGQ